MLDDSLILAGIDQRVKLNVGGVEYETTMEHISLLPKLFKIANERWLLDPESKIGEIFVDRNGLRFAYCLDYVRDGEVAIPSSITVESLVRDLKYYEVSDISANSIKNTKHGLPEMMASITLMSKQIGDDIKITSTHFYSSSRPLLNMPSAREECLSLQQSPRFYASNSKRGTTFSTNQSTFTTISQRTRNHLIF